MFLHMQHSPPPVEISAPQLSHLMVTCSRLSVVKPNPKYASTISTLTILHVPRSVQSALSYSGWKATMNKELAVLHQNKTWQLVPCTLDIHVVGSKWVFKPKLKPKPNLLTRFWFEPNGQLC